MYFNLRRLSSLFRFFIEDTCRRLQLANLVLIVSVVPIFCQIVFYIFMQVFESLCQIYVIHVNICYQYLFWLWAVIKAYIYCCKIIEHPAALVFNILDRLSFSKFWLDIYKQCNFL